MTTLNVRNIRRSLDEKVRRDVRDAARVVLREAVRIAPYRTGRLRGGLYQETSTSRNQIEVTVTSRAPYTKYVERRRRFLRASLNRGRSLLKARGYR